MNKRSLNKGNSEVINKLMQWDFTDDMPTVECSDDMHKTLLENYRTFFMISIRILMR
ncbi:hypothetical protein [Clostridium sp. DMHC 10]|uniref:hypothetical protein n=1 Tax=Clostridium sp. DMHC 10 TaxID=747377 RepID=UPI000B054648|nr:hypothetical protein [Clostridium sp. DMHC 10]